MTIVVVFATAALAPLLCQLAKRVLNIPVVVMEVFLGIIIGPGVLGLVSSNPILAGLAAIGVWFLFYSAGYETDFFSIRDRLPIASAAWLACLVLAVGAGMIIAAFLPETYTSRFVAAVFIGGALVSTGLGTMLPMMRDANQIETRIGRAVISSGVIGQFAPQIALGIIVGVFRPLPSLGLHAAFFIATAGLIWLAGRYGMPRAAAQTQTATLDTGAQWGVVFQAAICFAFVLIGDLLGVDRAIGAFAAGLLTRQLLFRTPAAERHVIDRKMKGIAGGMLLPIFFIHAGITFDLPGLIAQPAAFALIPLFFILKLLLRGVPGSVTLERPNSFRERASVSLLVGTGLAAVILISQHGLAAGAISSTTASALIGAAMLTVLVYPTIALNLANADPANQTPANQAPANQAPANQAPANLIVTDPAPADLLPAYPYPQVETDFSVEPDAQLPTDYGVMAATAQGPRVYHVAPINQAVPVG